MLMVGIVGGISYANCIFGIFHDNNIPKKNKEVSSSLNILMSNLGILLSSLVGFIVETFIFQS